MLAAARKSVSLHSCRDRISLNSQQRHKVLERPARKMLPVEHQLPLVEAEFILPVARLLS